MDFNRPTEQQQLQSQQDDSPRGRQFRPTSSQSNMAQGTSSTFAGYSETFTPFPEVRRMRSDIPQLSAPRGTSEPDLHYENNSEAGPTDEQTPVPILPPKSVAPDRPNSAPTNSPSEISPLSPAIISSRGNTTRSTDNNANRAQLHNNYNNLGFTTVPPGPTRESRRLSSGPERTLDRSLRTGTGTEVDWIVPVEEKV